MDVDAVFPAVCLIFFSHRHLIVRLEAVEVYLLCAVSLCCTCNVSSDASAADDYDISAEFDVIAAVDVLKELNTGDYSLCIIARDTEPAAVLESDAEVERLESLLTEFRNGHVCTDFHSAFKLYAECSQNVDLGVNYILLEPERRDAVYEHSARSLFLFKYGYFISACCQIVSTGDSRRAGTDDSDLLVMIPELSRNESL